MPIYEYDCQKCGRRTEVLQQLSEKPLKICPRCGGKLRKAASAPAIRFKGSGWYVTDYARARKEEKHASSGKADPESKAADSASEPKKEKPAETKSAMKKESKKDS
jgi:putative FmdB family regulatory protein